MIYNITLIYTDFMIFHNLSKKLSFFIGEKKYQILIMTEPNPNIHLLFYYGNETGTLEVSKDDITFKLVLRPLDFCFHYDTAGVSFPDPITTIMIDTFKKKIENNEYSILYFDKFAPSYIKYYDNYLWIVTENTNMKVKISDKNIIYDEFLAHFKDWINELIDG